MKPLMTLALAAACLAPVDALRAEGNQPVLEIVTYRLKAGEDTAAHIAAARRTAQFLEETGAVLYRALTVDDDGLWTDVIRWTSRDAAKAAEAEAMTRPEFGAFFGAIDEASVSMRHPSIVWQME